MTEYSQKFKTLLDIELVEILMNSNQYDEVAIDDVHQEFKERGISEEGIQSMKVKIEQERAIQKHDSEKFQKEWQKWRAVIDPIKKGENIPKKNIIRVIAALFLMVVIMDLSQVFTLIYTVLVDIGYYEFYSDMTYIFTLLLGLIPVSIMTLGLSKFVFRKPIGWMILTGFSIFILIERLFGIYQRYQMHEQLHHGHDHHHDMFPMDDQFVLFPMVTVINLAIYVLVIWQNMSPEIREAYNIDDKRRNKTIIVSISLFIGMLLLGFIIGLLAG